MSEIAVQFGTSEMIGVLNRPTDSPEKNRRVFVIFNSGIMHHVGSCRMSVQIARALALSDTASFRFDLPGIGDSLQREKFAVDDNGETQDTREALDYLASVWGYREFVLFGLCSGAYLSLSTAVSDNRVVGVVQIDGYAYRTSLHYVRYYLPKLLDFNKWKRAVISRIGKKGKRSASTPSIAEQQRSNPLMEITEWPPFPPRSDIANAYRILRGRNVWLLNFITGGQKDLYSYANQFYDMFFDVDFGKFSHVVFIPQATHILKEREYQHLVLDTITDWFFSKFCAEDSNYIL